MTGTGLLGLILISMGWLFFLAGLAINYRAKSPIPVLVGLIGSITVFFSIPALARLGVDVPWPWLWILLPLIVGCANRMRGSPWRTTRHPPRS
jgi:hypothetical protein